ncbi:MAG: hypothetical protein EOO03_06845 [Chitinophagaceae bacterium]|nr:MAG: hypothetical protein EOO03_06845 [Chitinophagaceae bacterium]
MKKMIAIVMLAALATGCAETTDKKVEATTTETNANAPESEASRREKEIRDSTKMLDAQLNDTSSSNQ